MATKWILLCCLIGFCQVIFGQEIGKVYTIKLKDGSVINAQILEINRDVWIVGNNILGNVPIDRTQIASIVDENNREIVISREKPTRASIINPVPERYFYLPSAFNLPKGEHLYQNIFIFISGYNYGITDRLSVGATLPTLILFPVPAGTFHVKYGFPLSEKARLGFQMDIGGYVLPFIGQTFLELGVGLLPQAVVTFGNSKVHTSLHLGKIVVASNFSPESSTLNMLGVSHISPISGRTFLVTQNNIFFNNSYLSLTPSLGLRIVSKRKTGSLDLGVIGLIDGNFLDASDALLNISFQKRFRKKRF